MKTFQNHFRRQGIRNTLVANLKETNLPEAFLIAAKDCELQRLKQIMERVPLDVTNLKDKYGNTALHIAVGAFCRISRVRLDNEDRSLMFYYNSIIETIKYLTNTCPALLSVTNTQGLVPIQLVENLKSEFFLYGVELLSQGFNGIELSQDDELSFKSYFLNKFTDDRFHLSAVPSVNKWLCTLTEKKLTSGQQLLDQEKIYFSKIAFLGDESAAKILVYNDVLCNGKFLETPLLFGHGGANHKSAVDMALTDGEIKEFRDNFPKLRPTLTPHSPESKQQGSSSSLGLE